MRLVAMLALRDLFRERLHLICNVAVLCGVLVPLLVLFGVKNGVYDALIGRLMANPATLRIETAGNSAFTAADADEVRGWPEAGFVTLKTRSIFDFVNVRLEGQPGRKDATLVPSGSGDPTLPEGLVLGATEAAVSDALARQMQIAPGARIEIVTQAEDRPRQLLLPLKVVAVVAPDRVVGRAVLANLAVLDLVEAFYDDYALPEHGIDAGRPLESRQAGFEGMRVFARDLDSLAPLQARIENRFGIRTEAQTAEVARIKGLGRNLDLALLLTVTVASAGLGAALVFGFWAETARKRRVLATLALLGLGGRALAVFPLVQALVSAALGLAASFALYTLAALTGARLFAVAGPEALFRISPLQAVAIAVAVMLFVGLSALAAVRGTSRTDPGVILREGA